MLRSAVSTLFAMMICLGLTAGTARAGGIAFRAAPLGTDDGVGWSGLRFGATTPQAVKDRYQIDTNNDIPHSLRLSQPDAAGVTIHALFAGKKDTDPLEAVSLRYAPGALDLGALQGDMGEDGQPRYPRERFQDWWVQVFPDKGVAAFVLHTPTGTDVPQVLLLPRAALPQAVRGLSADVTPVGVLVDPHAGEPRVMSFGTTLVTGRLSGLSGNDLLNLRIERRMVDGIAGGAMRYVYGAPGRYTADISGSFDRGKGGRVKVECRIEGAGPYGEVDASSHSESRLRSGDDAGRVSYDTALDAMSKAESSFAEAMARQGPPTPDQIRAAAWDHLFQAARLAAEYALTPTGVQ